MIIKENLSNNNQGQGRSWHKSAKDRKTMDSRVAESMIAVIDEDKLSVAPFVDSLAGTQLSDLVVLIITRVLGKNQRLWDSDSVLRGSAKQMIDAIVGTGLLKDDSPKHVALVIGQQDDSRREEGPMIEVDFYQVVNGSLPIKPVDTEG